MVETTNFQKFLEHILDIEFDDVNQLYETITSKVNHGPFKYAERGDDILIENTTSNITLKLTSDLAKKTILAQLDRDWGGPTQDVLAYWSYLKELKED